KLGALTLLSGFVRQSALLNEELAEGRPPGQPQADGEREYSRVLGELIDSANFPHTAAMLASAVLDSAEPESEDSDFSHGLELVLDGLAARISA
ncbi:MAG: TetR/AcrR family transcriptional regulator C-terminal domain-containing protein, partial [Microbacterium sp.]